MRLQLDANGNPIPDETPSIQASPFDETLDEFLNRARQHYKEVRNHFLQLGLVKMGPVKRENDHFRCLAAHLVGGHSWAVIARDHSRLKVAARSPKTIAGEARKTARLLGISLPNTPGPRRGSRRKAR